MSFNKRNELSLKMSRLWIVRRMNHHDHRSLFPCLFYSPETGPPRFHWTQMWPYKVRYSFTAANDQEVSLILNTKGAVHSKNLVSLPMSV